MLNKPILWTRDHVIDATQGRASGMNFAATGVSIDTRTLEAGDIFIALSGPNHDGHDFVAEAFAKGAAAAIVMARPDDIQKENSIIVVTDTTTSLENMGRYARARISAKIIGITGSVGKSSTKEMLYAVMSEQFKTHATLGNLNNHYGVPLTLARMPEDTEIAIIEMGMSAPNEISVLSQMCRPHIAIITAIAPAHIGAFQNIQDIAKEKSSIIVGLSKNGVLIINRDCKHYMQIIQHASKASFGRTLSFGTYQQADIRLLQYSLHENHSMVIIHIGGQDIIYKLGTQGLHQIYNSLAVLTATHTCGANIFKALNRLATVNLLEGRGEKIQLKTAFGGITVINDTYNANPTSMRTALFMLKNISGQRSIAILGDMLELGHHSEKLHQELAHDLIKQNIDCVHTCGEAMKTLYHSLPKEIRGEHAENSAYLAPLIVESFKDGDAILIKGSAKTNMRLIMQKIMSLNIQPLQNKESY